MKTKFKLLTMAGLLSAGILALVSLSSTGCGSLSGGGGTGTDTNSVPSTSLWNDTNFVSNTAFALKATIANGVAIANSEDKNAKAYITAVRDALAKLKGGSDYTPGALETALANVSVNELKGKYAQLVIVNLDLIYETYWGQMVRDGVNANPVASKLIQAVIDGIDLGQTGNLPQPPAALQRSWRLQRNH